MTIWHGIGSQLGRPTGLGGRVIGHIMRFVNDETNRIAVERLDIRAGDDVLELGCGPGHGIKLVASRVASGVVHGVDLSPVMLAQAGRRNRREVEKGRVVLHHASFDNLPFESASIDRILAVNVIYFWNDLEAVAAEALRVLRPGGKISIYATGRESMRRWKFAGPETHRHFGAGDLAETLRAEGFRQCDIRVGCVKIARRIEGLIAEITKPANTELSDHQISKGPAR